MIDPVKFRNAMGEAVTGVYLITTDGEEGRFGMTLSSLTSISLEPATVMISVRNQSPTLAAILGNRVFGVNVLGTHQAEVSDVFAGRPRSGERFDFGCAEFTDGDLDVPLLDDAIAALECRVWRTQEIHDHTLIFGLVEGCRTDDNEGVEVPHGAPLTYCRGRYCSAAPLACRRAPGCAGIRRMI